MVTQVQFQFKPLNAHFFRIPLLFLLLLIAAIPSFSRAIEAIESPQQYLSPEDMSGVHFYLITVDVGDMVWDNFGHTALRVYDENRGTDTVFNWGGFDVSGGVLSFSYNFFVGVMNYRMGTNTPNQEFATYRSQQRSLWQDKLNLSNPQKEILYRRLMWNMQPENIIYPYNYFFDNCTTRVRDYIDEALLGLVEDSTTAVTEYTFRDQVQAHYSSIGLVGFSLDILMNSNIDRPITEWEEMFLPLKLREHLLNIQSDVTDNGQRLKLLSDSELLLEFPPPTQDSDSYQVASLTILLPLFFLFVMLKKIPQSYYATHSRIGLKMSAVTFRILGLLGLLTAIFSGVYGLVMLLSWFISDHVDLHHNINLLLFWPTDILGVIVALRWFIFCKPYPTSNNTAPFVNYYLLAHVVGMAIYTVVAWLGLSAQESSNIALYIVPGFLLFTFITWLVGFGVAQQRQKFF